MPEDNASEHSGDDAVNPMEASYMSDATSRRSSVTEANNPISQDSEEFLKPFVAENNESHQPVQRRESEVLWVLFFFFFLNLFIGISNYCFCLQAQIQAKNVVIWPRPGCRN